MAPCVVPTWMLGALAALLAAPRGALADRASSAASHAASVVVTASGGGIGHGSEPIKELGYEAMQAMSKSLGETVSGFNEKVAGDLTAKAGDAAKAGGAYVALLKEQRAGHLSLDVGVRSFRASVERQHRGYAQDVRVALGGTASHGGGNTGTVDAARDTSTEDSELTDEERNRDAIKNQDTQDGELHDEEHSQNAIQNQHTQDAELHEEEHSQNAIQNQHTQDSELHDEEHSQNAIKNQDTQDAELHDEEHSQNAIQNQHTQDSELDHQEHNRDATKNQDTQDAELHNEEHSQNAIQNQHTEDSELHNEEHNRGTIQEHNTEDSQRNNQENQHNTVDQHMVASLNEAPEMTLAHEVGSKDEQKVIDAGITNTLEQKEPDFRQEPFHLTLRWKKDVDLDLHLNSPPHADTDSITGMHDEDVFDIGLTSNGKGQKTDGWHVNDITSEEEKLPAGRYRAWATFFSGVAGSNSPIAPKDVQLEQVPFEAELIIHDQRKIMKDKLAWEMGKDYNKVEQSMLVFDFEVDDDGKIEWKVPA